MKLSELVGYLHLLTQEDVNPDYNTAMKKFRAMEYMIINRNTKLGFGTAEFTHAVDQVQISFDKVHQVVDDLKDQIRYMIQQMEIQQFEQTERWYFEEERNTTETDYLLNHRRLAINQDDDILLRAHLKNCTDWRIPGMIIRPAQESFIEDLVAMDPLYLVDQHSELLQPAMSTFSPEYQRRLRPYTINDYQDEHPLWKLPDNQFGLIFVWNYFQYKPLKVLVRYLNDIYKKLRPGGVCIFTYNECDREYGAQSAEQNFMGYTPGRLIKDHLNWLGFETLLNHHGTVTWLKVKKPGEIESIRGGQALAKIVAH